MEHVAKPQFSGQPQLISCAALLLDFDGTIIDSTAAIVKNWHRLGKEIGVDPNIILANSHGKRSIDTLKLYAPDRANYDYIYEMESRIPKDFGDDAMEIPGARQLLTKLDEVDAPWAIVTSATKAIVAGWQDVLKLRQAKTMVLADDVDNGKPDPACYLLGRSRLGLDEREDLIVVEDSPSGIEAGKAAGFKVVGLVTTHTSDQVRQAGADWVVQDLRSVSIKTYVAGNIELLIEDTLES